MSGGAASPWNLLTTVESSSSPGRTHRIERHATTGELRCTCQGFRIFKRGRCRHTDAWRATNVFAAVEREKAEVTRRHVERLVVAEDVVVATPKGPETFRFRRAMILD